MDNSIFDKFQRKEKQVNTEDFSSFPGEVILRNGTKFLVTEYIVPGKLDIPHADHFGREFSSCLELLFGVRDKKTDKLKKQGILCLEHALDVPELKKEAKAALKAFENGFDSSKELLMSRFTSSHRLMFLLLSHFKNEELLFLDIETKSLFFETSIIQIGAGYFSGDDLVIKQFTILEDAAEPEVLEEFLKLLDGKKALVTFNGRTFDVPFLDGRFAYYDIDTDILDMHNFDLLHFSRAAFRGMQESYRLKDIETGILKKPRGEDIGGEEVEEMYDDFLETGDPKHLEPILFHNKEDILSLVAITQRIIEKWGK